MLSRRGLRDVKIVRETKRMRKGAKAAEKSRPVNHNTARAVGIITRATIKLVPREKRPALNKYLPEWAESVNDANLGAVTAPNAEANWGKKATIVTAKE